MIFTEIWDVKGDEVALIRYHVIASAATQLKQLQAHGTELLHH